MRRCEFWVWCAHKAGCDDNGEFNGHYPYHGCQLMQLPRETMPQNWNRGPSFSSFESGYVTGALLFCHEHIAVGFRSDEILELSRSEKAKIGVSQYGVQTVVDACCSDLVCRGIDGWYNVPPCLAVLLLT